MTNIFVHLGVSLAVGYLISKNPRRDRFLLIGAAISAGAVDIDAFISPGFRMFHNFFFSFEIPLILYFASGILKNPRSSDLRRFFILWSAMGFGHLTLDMWEGGVFHLLYPFSSQTFVIPSAGAYHRETVLSLTPGEKMMIAWSILIGTARLIYPAAPAEKTERDRWRTGQQIPHVIMPSGNLSYLRHRFVAITERLHFWIRKWAWETVAVVLSPAP